MTTELSPNTQAILLLTAPLLTGSNVSSSEVLTPGEYKRLDRHLREMRHQPADLLGTDGPEIAGKCEPVIDANRLLHLLERGFLLSQVADSWQTRAIWVISRVDDHYPGYFKARLGDDAPALLYGCGEIDLLETGGLAVVGSRHVDESLMEYTMDIGQLASQAGFTIVSGGARGIDQASMRGALEAGGKVVGVLADSLLKTTMNRENRNLILDGQLTLVSPYDPNAGFNVGNAMQRNKLIYALSNAALVVSSDVNKGGTWAGAVEQLEKLKYVPVYVRSTGASSPGLNALRKKGALPWPNPNNIGEFASVFEVNLPTTKKPVQSELMLFSCDDAVNMPLALRESPKMPTNKQCDKNASPSDTPHSRGSLETDKFTKTPCSMISQPPTTLVGVTSNMAEDLFISVRPILLKLLATPMKDTEVAVALDLSGAQTKLWLARLVGEGSALKLSKPTRYVSQATVDKDNREQA